MKSEKNNSDVAGTYVTESYKLRSEGYDWVAVSIKGAQDRMIDIAIRSRDDKKKPTCTFDGTGKEIQPDLYEAEYEGKKILFAFTDSTLYISAKNKDEENKLYFFCSGEASLKGEYYKLNEAIDKK